MANKVQKCLLLISLKCCKHHFLVSFGIWSLELDLILLNHKKLMVVKLSGIIWMTVVRSG